MWMTAENNVENEYEVVRISGLEPPRRRPDQRPPAKPKAPETKISKGPKKTVKTKGKKAKVTFKFSSSAAGASFECALVKMKRARARSAEAQVQELQIAEEVQPQAGEVPLQRPRRPRRRRRPLTGDQNLQGRPRQALSYGPTRRGRRSEGRTARPRSRACRGHDLPGSPADRPRGRRGSRRSRSGRAAAASFPPRREQERPKRPHRDNEQAELPMTSPCKADPHAQRNDRREHHDLAGHVHAHLIGGSEALC